MRSKLEEKTNKIFEDFFFLQNLLFLCFYCPSSCRGASYVLTAAAVIFCTYSNNLGLDVVRKSAGNSIPP